MIGLLTRFSLVGVANSLIGLGVIAVLDLGFHVRPALANAVAFMIGIAMSFFLTRSYVFRDRTHIMSRAWRFGLAMGFAFLLNQLVLAGAGHALGAGAAAHLEAQLMGLLTYTAANFLLCRYWVFSR
jgi:putative flippase GtrA